MSLNELLPRKHLNIPAVIFGTPLTAKSLDASTDSHNGVKIQMERFFAHNLTRCKRREKQGIYDVSCESKNHWVTKLLFRLFMDPMMNLFAVVGEIPWLIASIVVLAKLSYNRHYLMLAVKFKNILDEPCHGEVEVFQKKIHLLCFDVDAAIEKFRSAFSFSSSLVFLFPSHIINVISSDY